MKVLVPCASLFLTDNKPAGEGLICYELLKHLVKKGALEFEVFVPGKDILEHIEHVKIHETGHFKFFPAPSEFRYKINWLLYSIETSIKLRFMNTGKCDICHFMLPVNFEGSYSPVLKTPMVIGPVFYPWNQLEEEEYGEERIEKRGLIKKIKSRIIQKYNKYTRKKYYKTLDYADRIIITVDRVKEILPEKYHNKCVKIPVGVDTELFEPAEHLQDKNKILFLAYLVRRKGLEYLLKSMTEIIKEVDDAELTVVGDGPDRIYFENICRDLCLSDKVTFAGHVNHNDTCKFFRSSKLYCLPSLGEPFGLSIAEAMSSGLPVIVTDGGGAAEVVGPHNKDSIVPMRDSESLAEKIIYILKNYRYAHEKGKLNRQYAVEKYDWNIIAGQIYAVYKELTE